MGFWENKKVLVTGANGIIGAWLCRELAGKGAAVTGIVHSGTNNLELVEASDKVEAVKGELKDVGFIKAVFEKSKPEICFHLAAISSTAKAANDLKNAFETNVTATFDLLQAAAENNSAFCFASTVKVYGGNTEKPLEENDALNGSTAYAATKVCGEGLCRMFAANGMRVGMARIANIFGSHDLRYERMVPGTIRAALLGESPRIDGTGENEYDFLFIEDLAEGLLLFGEKLCKGEVSGEAINLGSNTFTSVNELAQKIIELAGAKVEIEHSGEKAAAKEKLSNEKAKKLLGWQPKHRLEEALKKTVEWYKSHKELL